MNVLRDGVDWLLSTIADTASESAIYSRGVQSTIVKVTAVENQQDAASPVARSYLESTIQRWTFRASSLLIGGAIVLPRTGDRIQIQRGTSTLTYEVMPVDDRAYQTDATGQMLIVSTRQV